MKQNLIDEIAALKKRIEELEKQPKQEFHYHYTYPPYYVQPQPYFLIYTTPWVVTSGGTTLG